MVVSTQNNVASKVEEPARNESYREAASTLQEVTQKPTEIVLNTEESKTNTPKNTAPKKRVSALSIKGIQQKQALEKQGTERHSNKPILKTPFTQEALQTAWDAYTQQIENKGQYNLASHLQMVTPVVEQNAIMLEYPNDTIRVEVLREKSNLLQHLREVLKNDLIDLKITVNETQQKRYAYTPQEKYEKLKEINPLLETLKNTLDLDL